jgi:hypothetical protein
MPFMPKDWVTLAAWRNYELRVLKRASKEVSLATWICTLLGTITGYALQYSQGLRTARDAFLVGGSMVVGAVLGFLSHFLLLVLSAPAKLADEAEARVHQLEVELAALKKRAEDEQTQIRRRGSAPFLKPVDDCWVRLHLDNGQGNISMLPPTRPAVLCGSTMEVKGLKDGDPVYFPFINHGQDAPAISLKLDDVPVPLGKEPDISSAHGYYYFAYPYEKAKHGQEQVLSLSFETTDGRHDTHQYLLVHGRRVLQRIDPALPSAT